MKVTLTDLKVKNLKVAPKGTRTQFMDALVPGFGVRVTDKGVKTYIMQARFPGSPNPARRELGNSELLTLEQAREKARGWSKLIKSGIDPKAVAEKERAEIFKKNSTTFDGICEDWFDAWLSTLRSGKLTKKRVKKHLIPIFKGMPLADITDLDILTKVVNPRIKTPSMARQLFNDCGAFFGWVIDQRVYGLKISPTATIKISKIVGKIVNRKRVLNDDEIRAYWIASTRLPYPDGPLYQLLMLSLLRLREASNTERAEWNLRGNAWEWTIPESRMKGKLAHLVPITADLRAIYDSLPKQGRFLLSHDGGVKPMAIGGRVKERMDEEMLTVLREMAAERGEDPAAVQPPLRWTNHDVRRTVRSKLSRIKGIDLETREAVLAHVKPGMQRVYDVYDQADEKREALELWAATLRQIVEPPPSNVIQMRATK